MTEYPPRPNEKVMATLDAYLREKKCWRATHVHSSQYNDRGVLKYKLVYLERVGEPLDYSKPITNSMVIERFIVKTEDAEHIICSKAMEKALESVK